jgi:putative intracellular protease/amidase
MMTTLDNLFAIERPETALAATPRPAAPTTLTLAGALPERIAVLVRDGVHREQIESTLEQLDRAGHDVRVLAERLGSVLCHDGSRLPVDASLRRWPAWHFDRVLRFASSSAEPVRLTTQEAAFVKPGEGASAVPLHCLDWPQQPKAACMH